MSRPEKERKISSSPVFTRFKPCGVPISKIKTVNLTLDEFEAIRLADYLGMEHSEAAEMMNISRPTFTRLIEKARNKSAQFLIEGLSLVVEGGNVTFEGNAIKCPRCKKISI